MIFCDMIVIFIFEYKPRSNEPDKRSDEPNANKHVFLLHMQHLKRTLLQWRMTSVDRPGIMFVGFFLE